ncbi:MAG: hypothetical protein QM723_15415 [Myxococcaceae bacterium]
MNDALLARFEMRADGALLMEFSEIEDNPPFRIRVLIEVSKFRSLTVDRVDLAGAKTEPLWFISSVEAVRRDGTAIALVGSHQVEFERLVVSSTNGSTISLHDGSFDVTLTGLSTLTPG